MRTCYYGWDKELEIYSIKPSKNNVYLHYSHQFVNQVPNPEYLTWLMLTRILESNDFYTIAWLIDESFCDLSTIPSLYIENAIIQFARIELGCQNIYSTFEFCRIIIGYYKKLLIDKSIEIAIMKMIPHLAIDYLFSVAAYQLRIPCFALAPLRGVSYQWDREPLQEEITFQIVNPLNGKIYDSKLFNSHRYFSTKALTKHAIDLYNDQNYGLDKYSSVIINSFKSSNKEAKKVIHNCNISKSLEFIGKLKYEYEKNSTYFSDNVETDNYIFLPLHKQPEMSTHPMAGNLWSQKLLIYYWSLIAEDMGLKLIVKEHPHIFKWSVAFNSHFMSKARFPRHRNFYNSFSQNENVIFASLGSNSSSLAKSNFCKAVITTEGTIGAISALNSKLTFISGNPWYRDLNSCLKVNCNTLRDEKTIIRSLIEEYSKDHNRIDIKTIQDYCSRYSKKYLITIKKDDLNDFLSKIKI